MFYLETPRWKASKSRKMMKPAIDTMEAYWPFDTPISSFFNSQGGYADPLSLQNVTFNQGHSMLFLFVLKNTFCSSKRTFGMSFCRAQCLSDTNKSEKIVLVSWFILYTHHLSLVRKNVGRIKGKQ